MMNDFPAAAALAALARGRDPAAWSAVLAGAGPAIEGLARRLTGDADLARDAVQEALLQIRDDAGLFRPRGTDADAAARSWIMRVAANAALQIVRREGRRRERERRAPDPRQPAPAPAEALLRAEDLDLLRRELAALPEATRSAIVLRHLCGQDHAGVAAALGCSIAAAKMRIGRGLELLRGRLGRLGVGCSAAVLVGSLEQLPAAEGPAIAATAGPLLTSPAVSGVAGLGSGLSGGMLLAASLALGAVLAAGGIIAARPSVPAPVAVAAAEVAPPAPAADPRDAALAALLDEPGRLIAMASLKAQPAARGRLPVLPDPPATLGDILARCANGDGVKAPFTLVVDARQRLALHEAVDAAGLAGLSARAILDRYAARVGAAWRIQGGGVAWMDEGRRTWVDLGQRITYAREADRIEGLEDALQGMAAHGIPVVLAPDSQSRADCIADLLALDLPLEEALDWLAASGQTRWWTRDGRIVIGGEGDAPIDDRSDILRLYDVSDLARVPDAATWPQVAGLDRILAPLETATPWLDCRDSADWNETPLPVGQAPLAAELRRALANNQGRRTLLIQRDQRGHRSVDASFRRWRQACILPGGIPACLDEEAARRAAVLARLAGPLRSRLPAQPMRERLLGLARAAGVSLVLDPALWTPLIACPPLEDGTSIADGLRALPYLRFRLDRSVLIASRAPDEAKPPPPPATNRDF